MKRFAVREHIPSILVATLGAMFGVSLLLGVGALTVLISADDVTGSSGTVAALLAVVAWVFIIIAIYVSAVVTSNTFATIIAGRTRTIALLRLIGASASDQRKAVAREGFIVGAIGAILGTILGTALVAGLMSTLVALDIVAALEFRYLDPVVLLPVVAVILTTWLASWVGSRRVLTVSPIQATGAAQEMTREETTARRSRNAVAIVLFASGIGLLLLGMVVGLVTQLGVLIGIVGGLLSFTGLVLGAHLVMPPALRLVGRAFGNSASAKLAAENAVRYPERSSRTTIGLVIGITLVTMFAVAISSFQTIIYGAQEADPAYYEGIDQMVLITVLVFSVLTGFSALIAAVGMVNNLSLSVLQRTRELGLLRALGFTAKQVRRMILAESAQLVAASVLVGLVLGIFYGWAGAQSLLGSINGNPGFVLPTVPLGLIGVIVVAAIVLTVAASTAPARRATRVAPVVALAVE